MKIPKLPFPGAVALLSLIVLFAACKTSDVTPTPPPQDTTKVTPPPPPPPVVHDWVVTTVAGSAAAGFADGDSTAAQFNNAEAIVADNNGNLFVGDIANSSIRKVTYAGHVSTYTGKNITTPDPAFGNIFGITLDSHGNLYTVEYSLIRKIGSPTASAVFAGSLAANVVDGIGNKAAFNIIHNLAIDQSGNIFVPDYDLKDNSILRKISADGVVTTMKLLDNTGIGTDGSPDLHYNHSITIDPSGNIYVTAAGNSTIEKITPDGTVTVLAGSSGLGFADGKGANASFGSIVSMTCDAAGNLFVCDSNNHAIREIAPDGTVTTIAGSGTIGYADGKGKSALFKFPSGITVDNAGVVYVADSGNNRIRKLEYK